MQFLSLPILNPAGNMLWKMFIRYGFKFFDNQYIPTIIIIIIFSGHAFRVYAILIIIVNHA
jgi:hypothetical protein